MQINSNFINLNKNSSLNSANLKTDETNSKSENLQSDKSAILHDASNLASETNNKQASVSKNPYAKELVTSLQTKKGAIFAQIMQLNAQLVRMQGA